jgi:hypothetical protein
MNEFLNTLPWRLASIAALAVGIVTLATGAADAWGGVERVGIAFAAFYIIGSVAKALLAIGAQSPERNRSKRSTGHRAEAHAAYRQPAASPDVSGMVDVTAGGVDGNTNL